MITIYIDNLFQLIDAFCKIGETLDMAIYRRPVRCCKIIIDDNAKKVDAILDSKKVLLNDYDVLRLDTPVRLDLFNAFQIMLYAYKTMSKRLLAFKEDCDKYKCATENAKLFKQIKNEVTLLLERTVDQIAYISESMIMLVDKGNFLKRSYSQIDETLDKDYLLERTTIEERINDLFSSVSDIDSTCDNDIHVASETKDKADDRADDRVDEADKKEESSDKCSFDNSSEKKASDNSSLESSTSDKSTDKCSDRSSSSNPDDSKDSAFKIVPNKHIMEDKPVNDDNSFDQ